MSDLEPATTHEELIYDLQMRMMEQEQLIDVLNDQILEQNRRLAKMEKVIETMENQVNVFLEDQGQSAKPAFEQPPHY